MSSRLKVVLLVYPDFFVMRANLHKHADCSILKLSQYRKRDDMEEYKKALRMYADFSSRSSRRDYWIVVVINLALSLMLEFLGLKFFGFVYGLFFFIPGLALTVRRLHDIEKSGKWVLVALIPLVGWIWLTFLLAKPGDDLSNAYGDIPA